MPRPLPTPARNVAARRPQPDERG
ncbi:MAG: hypothetical protein QOJ09_2983, partial [Actinomycetota bacterium]|nr:hypothetical protein [Actinomycetota bacterium]